MKAGGSLRRRAWSRSPELAELENTLLLTSKEFWKVPPSHGENTGNVFHLFSQGYRGWNNLFPFSKTITPVGWGIEWVVSWGAFKSLADSLALTSIAFFTYPRVLDKPEAEPRIGAQKARLILGLHPGTIGLSSQPDSALRLQREQKLLPSESQPYYSAITCMGSLVCSLFPILLCSPRFQSSWPSLPRYQILPRHPTLIKRPVDTKIQVPGQKQTQNWLLILVSIPSYISTKKWMYHFYFHLNLFFLLKIQIRSHGILSRERATFTLISIKAWMPALGAHFGNSFPSGSLYPVPPFKYLPAFLGCQDLVEPPHWSTHQMTSFSKQYSFCTGCF